MKLRIEFGELHIHIHIEDAQVLARINELASHISDHEQKLKQVLDQQEGEQTK
jgi:hypothetical protein